MKQALLIVTLFLALTGAADAALYPGKSQGLAPAVKEIGFANVLAFQPANKPAVALRSGYKNGVAAIYQKGGTKTPTEAIATIYVYTSSAKATLAWQKSCAKCKKQSAPAGIRLKVQAGTSNGQLTLHEITACGNVYLDVVEQNPGSVTGIDTDVAKITNAVFSRAIARGLTSCSAK